MSLNDILHRYCVCCFNPIIDIAADEEAYPYGQLVQTAAVPVGAGVEPPPIDIEVNQQAGVEQPQVYSVTWEKEAHTPVDMEGIDEINGVVARPADIPQEDLHSVSWKAVSKGPSTWGGEEGDVAAWEEGNGEAEQFKSLPLPWEKKQFGGLVPWNGKTIGPSWEDPRAHLPSSSTQAKADRPADDKIQVKPDDKIDQSQVTTADKSDKSQVVAEGKADNTQETTNGEARKAGKFQTTTEVMADDDNTINK